MSDDGAVVIDLGATDTFHGAALDRLGVHFNVFWLKSATGRDDGLGGPVDARSIESTEVHWFYDDPSSRLLPAAA